MALLALGELGGDELRGRALHHLLIEAGNELVVKLAVPQQIARLEERRADGHVGLGRANALADRAGGMADFESHVPETIKNRFGDRFAPRGLLVGKQEQEIDVGTGGEHAAAVAACGDDRHALGFGRILRRIEVLDRELEQHAHDLVLHGGQPLGAAPPVPVGKQQPLDAGAAARERATQVARDRQSQLARVAGVDFGQALEFGRDANRIEKFGFPGRLSQGQHGFMAIAKRRRRVIPNRAAWAHIVSPCGEDSVLPRTGPE